LDKIKYYTINSHLDVGQQYNLLIKEFPKYSIKKKNLYNAIQQFRDVRVYDESDMAIIFSYLMKLCDKDPNYIIMPCLEGLSNKLTGLF